MAAVNLAAIIIIRLFLWSRHWTWYHDGVIDSNEIANASAELLTLDKNGDGVLTTNEYLPTPPNNGGFHGRHFNPANTPLVKALDVNGDGVIDANEIANAPAELRDTDKNGDGKLTPDEYMDGHHMVDRVVAGDRTAVGHRPTVRTDSS